MNYVLWYGTVLFESMYMRKHTMSIPIFDLRIRGFLSLFATARKGVMSHVSLMVSFLERAGKSTLIISTAWWSTRGDAIMGNVWCYTHESQQWCNEI